MGGEGERVPSGFNEGNFESEIFFIPERGDIVAEGGDNDGDGGLEPRPFTAADIEIPLETRLYSFSCGFSDITVAATWGVSGGVM